MQFSFRKPHFWHPQNFAKNTILAQCDTICVFKNTPKHFKMGKTVKKLDQFLTLDLDQFSTLETPKIGPVFNSTASNKGSEEGVRGFENGFAEGSQKLKKQNRGRKANNHKQLFEIVPGTSRGQISFCVSFLLGRKRKKHKHNFQEISQKPWDSPGAIPWKFCLCVFLFTFFYFVFLPCQREKSGSFTRGRCRRGRSGNSPFLQ